MIGIRPTLSVVVGAALCAGLLRSGADGPGAALNADRLVADRAAVAVDRLDELERSLEPAVEAARRGAARIVAGDVAPSVQLVRAAEHLGRSESVAVEVGDAMTDLGAARRARDPSATSPATPLSAAELSSIAAQLEGTAGPADAFATMRWRADGVVREVERALAALEDGDLDRAQSALDDARREHAAVEAWEAAPVTLPVWLETTDAMIGSMERIIRATRSGDTAAARRAASAFAALEGEAAVADRALRIAISEGGAAVVAAPLDRLAAAVASVRATRTEVVAILQAEGR